MPADDRAAGRVDVEPDVLVGVLGGEQQQLRADRVGDLVLDLRAEEDDPLAQQPVVDAGRRGPCPCGCGERPLRGLEAGGDQLAHCGLTCSRVVLRCGLCSVIASAVDHVTRGPGHGLPAGRVFADGARRCSPGRATSRRAGMRRGPRAYGGRRWLVTLVVVPAVVEPRSSASSRLDLLVGRRGPRAAPRGRPSRPDASTTLALLEHQGQRLAADDLADQQPGPGRPARAAGRTGPGSCRSAARCG